MDVHRPGYGAHRAGADAQRPGGFERPLPQHRVRRQTEVVVRRQVDDLTVVERALVGLFAVEHAQPPVESLLFQRIELGAEKSEGIATHCAQCSSPPKRSSTVNQRNVST